MGQLWATSTQGGYLYSPLLTKEVTRNAQPDMKFKQFVTMREEWGKNAGETFLFDKYGNIDTQGGTLTETSTIPSRSYRLYQSTATLYEWGNSIPWTRKYESLAQANDRKGPVTKLKDDMAKVIDTAIEAEFDKCKIRYAATSTSTGTWSTDGTAGAENTSQFNTYHCKEIVDYMYQTMLAEPWDGTNYMGILSTDAKRGIYDELEDILQYTKYPASGEIGKYYDVRMVKTNHALSNTMGSGDAYGEAYIFGGNEAPVCEGVAITPEIIPKELTDFGRSKGLAWYMIAGFKIFWEGDPDNNIVKFDST